ncbi:hypothetical protein EFA46_008070 [Halarchaeum sp. CBA1220]|uniref:DUF7525 family protein n=1 Tax=Halarchaeum sp. CBA1220 TaxID=1853682 RepID=UPI0015A32FEA|nr:hypothetical protein [Halarchaeum sp. CBA1220]QLC34160.1 hypothetical protein EFA46_008070 [Halarchaeum sp. CBA1220]
MAESTTDEGVGIGLAFGAVATLGALYMLVSHAQVASSNGFAVAMVAGMLAVAAFHVFE